MGKRILDAINESVEFQSDYTEYGMITEEELIYMGDTEYELRRRIACTN